MTDRIRNCFFVFCCIIIVGCGESTNINETSHNDKLSIEDKLIYAINLNCKYILSDWWYSPKDIAFQQTSWIPSSKPLTLEQQLKVNNSLNSFVNWDNDDYLYIPNWMKSECSEQAILPNCYACRVLSTAIHEDIYDENITGVSKEIAISKAIKLISSLAFYHCSNSENGWGGCWQGALWAEMLGMSAFLMKNYLPQKDWNMICNMIKFECYYVINNAGVQVFRNVSGDIIAGREGDSQCETVAWNSTILALAILVLSNDENLKTWKDSFVEFNLHAMAVPSDVGTEKIIDGYSLVNLKGSNINEDGTVINHAKIHIDYMVSPIESIAESSIVLSYLDKYPLFECLCFNIEKVYDALVNLDLGVYNLSKVGHHFYERSSLGDVSWVTNMPEENEWGSNRQANYFLVDTYVSLIGADNNLPNKYKAEKWANCRMEKIILMIERDYSGKIYRDGEENFASGQLYAMACLSQAYSLLRGHLIQK